MKFKIFLIAVICIVLSQKGTAQNSAKPFDVNRLSTKNLSRSASVSLLTCGSGNDFYLSFGHTSLRVYDSIQNIDEVYNYGTFDFDTPNLYGKFAQGTLLYQVSVSKYRDFVAEYQYEGRSLYEQKLKLTLPEKQKLYNALRENYLPHNRYYHYDFFRDNCASRVRDIINEALINRTLFVESVSDTNKTFRQMIRPYSDNTLLWWQLGVDIILGMRCDTKISNMQYMFIPFDLMNQLDTSRIAGTRETLAEPPVQILKETKEPNVDSISPLWVFWMLFGIILAVSIIGYYKRWKLRWLDILVFTSVCIVFCLIFYMWFLSDHWCTKYNLNILWANPLLLYILFRLRKSNKIVIYITLLCLAVPIIGFYSLPQQFHPAVIPIVLILVVRLLSYLLPQHLQNNISG